LQHRLVNKEFDKLGYETGKINYFYKNELKKLE
jgi:hypothetical protein